MLQGPKGFMAQKCEVHLQYGNKMAVLHFFSSKFLSNIYSIFSLPKSGSNPESPVQILKKSLTLNL